jgi:hypothetical protein
MPELTRTVLTAVLLIPTAGLCLASKSLFADGACRPVLTGMLL